MCLSHFIYTVRPCLIHTCHAHAMPFFSRPPLDGRALAFRRTAWHGHGMASVNRTRPHCVNQMGKTHSKPLAHDMAGYGHGCGMLCVNESVFRRRSFATHILSLSFPDQISATSSPAVRAENHMGYFSATFALLVCYTANSGCSLPTFRDNLSVRVKESKKNAGNTMEGKFVAL